MNLTEWFELLYKLLPFILVINGLTTFAGKMGLQGKPQAAFAMGIGTVIGELGYLATYGLPVAFGDYIWAGLAGLFIGVISVLFYETLKVVFEKAMSTFIKNAETEAENMVQPKG